MSDDTELGRRAARRLGILGRQLERVGLADLRRVVTVGEAPGRARLRARAEKAAVEAGLGDLLGDARSRARDWVDLAYARGGYDPTSVGLNWGRTFGTAAERVAVFRSVDDAVLATVARELVPVEDHQALMEPYTRMLALRPERPARRRG